MKTSTTVTKIIPALLKAQKSMGGASKGASNPYFKSKYADYGAVLEACKDLLNDNGIVILQPHENREGRNFVITTLAHESGEFISSETEVVCAKANDPQALGSAITYARRYGLQSLTAMPAEDDDGNAGSGRTVSRVETKAAPVAAMAAAPVTAKAETIAPPKVTPAIVTPVTNARSSFKKSTPAAVTETATAGDGWE